MKKQIHFLVEEEYFNKLMKKAKSYGLTLTGLMTILIKREIRRKLI